MLVLAWIQKVHLRVARSTVLSLDNGNTITSPYNIANTFNNYFAPIAETTKNNIQYSHKHFSDYLKNEYDSAIFLQHTCKEEIANIISPLLIVYLIEYYFLWKMKFQCNCQIHSTFLSWLVFFQRNSKLQRVTQVLRKIQY